MRGTGVWNGPRRTPTYWLLRRRVGVLCAIVALVLIFVPVSACWGAEPTTHELQAEIRELAKENSHTESYVNKVLLPLEILVGLLAGGGLVGLVTSIRYERRQAQLHDLAVRGESASQTRAEQSHVAFLAGSQETLNLVNDTLSLARQASERAAEAQHDKVRERMDELDRAARAILDEVYAKHDFKEVVKNASFRDGLVDIAHKLETIAYLGLFETNPPAACMFARGINYHLESAARKALDSFRAAEDPEDPKLSALALYWAGYEANNLADYTRASDHFSRARTKYLVEETEKAQRHELSRMELKTQFFAIASGPDTQARRKRIADLVAQLQRHIDELERESRDEFVTERHLYYETIGEMYQWSAR
jgi:hypothetical protein